MGLRGRIVRLTILRVTSGVGGETAFRGAAARGGVDGLSMVGEDVQSRSSLILKTRLKRWRLGFIIFGSLGGARHRIPEPRISCDSLCKPNPE